MFDLQVSQNLKRIDQARTHSDKLGEFSHLDSCDVMTETVQSLPAPVGSLRSSILETRFQDLLE